MQLITLTYVHISSLQLHHMTTYPIILCHIVPNVLMWLLIC